MKNILARVMTKENKKMIFTSITSGIIGMYLYNQMQKSKKTEVDEKIDMFENDSNYKYVLDLKEETMKMYEVRDAISEFIYDTKLDPNLEVIGITLYTNKTESRVSKN